MTTMIRLTVIVLLGIVVSCKAQSCSVEGLFESSSSCCGTLVSYPSTNNFQYTPNQAYVPDKCCRKGLTLQSLSPYFLTDISDFYGGCYCSLEQAPDCVSEKAKGKQPVDDSCCGQVQLFGVMYKYQATNEEKTGVCYREFTEPFQVSPSNPEGTFLQDRQFANPLGKCLCSSSSPCVTTPVPPTTTPLPTTTPPTTPPPSTTPPPTSPPPTSPPPTSSPPPPTTTMMPTTTPLDTCAIDKSVADNPADCGQMVDIYPGFLYKYDPSPKELSGECCRSGVEVTQSTYFSNADKPAAGDCYCEVIPTTTPAPTTTPITYCPVYEPLSRLLGATQDDSCQADGLIRFTGSNGNTVCNGAYVYNPTFPVPYNFFGVMISDTQCIANMQETLAQTAAANFPFSIEGAMGTTTFDFNLTAGPTGDILDSLDIGNGITAMLPSQDLLKQLQAANCEKQACIYDPATMESVIDRTKCKIDSYGTNAFQDFNYAYDPNNPYFVEVTLSADGATATPTASGVSFCAGDGGAAVYCELTTGERVLVGLLPYENTCADTTTFNVNQINA